MHHSGGNTLRLEMVHILHVFKCLICHIAMLKKHGNVKHPRIGQAAFHVLLLKAFQLFTCIQRALPKTFRWIYT